VSRREKSVITALRTAIVELVAADGPYTVRQIFYRLTSQGLIAKTEAEYKQTVVRLVTRMRLEGQISFGVIADNTRWIRKPNTYSSLEQALSRTAQAYRRSLWDEQKSYVEIWCEKEALAGVLVEETALWDVPLMVTRGYGSITYLHDAAEIYGAIHKPVYVYYFARILRASRFAF
jgi:hypothetical protein